MKELKDALVSLLIVWIGLFTILGCINNYC